MYQRHNTNFSTFYIKILSNASSNEIKKIF